MAIISFWACPFASLRVGVFRGSPSAPCFAPLRALHTPHANPHTPRPKATNPVNPKNHVQTIALAAWRARRGAKHRAKRSPEGGGGFSRNAPKMIIKSSFFFICLCYPIFRGQATLNGILLYSSISIFLRPYIILFFETGLLIHSKH